MSTEVKVIIGANYGDEGKGLASHYFSQQAKLNNKKCLNILFNGGCQRGHTVDYKDGTRHVFHHFGAGLLDGADTYFDSDFMVNPLVFIDELQDLFHVVRDRHIYANMGCRVITPYDAFINQLVEERRGDNRHGSCGHGIWETHKRYEDSGYNWSLGKFIREQNDERIKYLTHIRDIYLPNRLLKYGILMKDVPKKYLDVINSEEVLRSYLNALDAFIRIIKPIYSFTDIKKNYDSLIFEGAQGLALDENNKAEYPNVTASKTGSVIPLQRIKGMDCDVEVCYITRSYFTRHGAGFLPNECSKEEINSDIVDETNIFNDFQQNIRYAPFDFKPFFTRVMSDFIATREPEYPLKYSFFVTHLNYCDCDIPEKYRTTIYASATKYAEDVEVYLYEKRQP